VTIDPTTIIGPLIGAFAGVSLGFIANELWRRKIASERRSFLRKFLLHEIDRAIELLEKKNLNLIPIYAWNSLVSSGDLALFSNNIVSDLSDLYFEVEDYNYDAYWTWERKYEWDAEGDVKDQERSPYLQEWAKRILARLKDTKEKLE
jgi:hypothetical protein